MIQFEKLENYVEGRKRYVSLQDPEALKEYLLGGASSMQRASIDARPANFAEHPSIVDARGKFLAKKTATAMPFDVSPRLKVRCVERLLLFSEGSEVDGKQHAT